MLKKNALCLKQHTNVSPAVVLGLIKILSASFFDNYTRYSKIFRREFEVSSI